MADPIVPAIPQPDAAPPLDPSAPIRDPKALESFYSGQEGQTQTATGGSLTPLTEKALDFISGSPEKFIQENLRPGIPLQVNPPEEAPMQGLMGTFSPWLRFQTARRQTVADQQAYLETQFPGKVRKAANTDDFIIEVADPVTGKPRDVLLNEEKMTVGDLAAIAAKGPELALAIYSAAAAGRGKLMGALPKLVRGGVQLLAGAAGLKAGEAAQQIETRAEQGEPIQPGEVIGEKAREIPGQAGLDVATLGIFKTANLGRRLFQGGPGMFKTDIQRQGSEGIRHLIRTRGQNLELTGGQASGMPLLIFTEAYAAAKPQATAAVKEFEARQLSEIKAMGEALHPAAGTDEEAGNKLLGFLKSNEQAKEDALNKVRQTMTEQEQIALERQLGKVGRVVPDFKPGETGGQLRKGFQDIYQGVKGKVAQAYKDAYAVPGATLPDVPTKTFVDEINALQKRFPTSEGIAWLEQYKKDIPAKEAYRDIVQRRSDLWNKIEESPADRETKDYIHGQLSKAMTDTLDDATKNIINPKFRGLIQKANEIYKTEELPFYQKGLRDVLLKEGVPGSPENIQLLDRFQQSSDLYKRLVNVAGKGSVPHEALKTSIIDGLLTKSGKTAIDPQWIDAAKFADNLQELATNKNTRELFQDVFGNRGRSLLEQARAMSGIQGNLAKDEAEALLKGGAPTATKNRLKHVLDAQNQVDTVEAKRLLKGSIDEINPEELVNRYADKLTEGELTILTRRLQRDAPDLLDQMQDKQIEQILGKAGTYETWNRSSLEKVLNDPKMRPKYETLLGDKLTDLDMFAKALGPIQYAEEVAKGTGQLVKGESIGELSKIFKIDPHSKKNILSRLFEAAPPWIAWKLTAKFLNTGTFRHWAARDFPPGIENMVPVAVASEPFLEDIASSASSPEVVRSLVLSARNYVNRVSKPTEKKEPQAPLKSKQELEKFFQTQ